MQYIFLPFMNFDEIHLCDEYLDWIEEWLYKLNERIEKECICSSECVQGLICETVIGKKSINWEEVEKVFLTDEDGNPLAYSEGYGKRLYKFASQWKQMPVHAIYNSFWIAKYYERDISKYVSLIKGFIQENGWIYNPDVSSTQIRTRMRSELMMSMAMGTEVLKEKGMDDREKNSFEATLATIPITGFISAEFFRKKALENIERQYQYPSGLKNMLEQCEAGKGYNDFSVENKTDDYMGTKKRTGHDAAIHTPLISCMAYFLSSLNEKELKPVLDRRMREYSQILEKKPLDIPPFQMRDIEYPFGTGISPLEVLSAASIMYKFSKEGK